MCKKLKWSVDDPRFEDVTLAQWQWYAQMISDDNKSEFDMWLTFVEYLASFWNSEGVEKMRTARKSMESHNFMGDEEFEDHIVSGSYKDNEIIKALQKLRGDDANNQGLSSERLSDRKIKGPVDLTSLAKMYRD